MKQKTCKALSCKQKFTPARPLQSCCSIKCAIEHSNRTKAKQIASESTRKRKEHREAKQRLKSRSDWVKEAQAAVNAYCRARDIAAGHPCICCGKPFEPQRPGGSVDAGHYLGRGAYPNLRFEELNIHAQRKNCNRPGGTTAASFRLGMIARIGIEAVEKLESDHEARHYSIDDLKEIKAKYSRMARELEKKNG
jgi:hypothetical protein